MLQIIKGLLWLVNLFMQRVDDATQREIGKDQYVKSVLVSLSLRAGIAKSIDLRSHSYSDLTVDDILRKYYRDPESSQ